jgi:lipoprotein-anchoring transpeptidase ErfK/SrfK
MRSLTWIAAGCAAGLALWLTSQDRVQSAPPHAKTAAIPLRPSEAARPSGARIWYGADHYPKFTLPDGRQEVVRSVLNITAAMKFGDFAWNEDHIPAGPVWVRVDLSRQLVSVFRGGHEIGSAVILYGTDGKPTPTGSFTVLQKDADYVSHTYDAPMPYMLRLTNDGVAIHGSSVRQGYATHGCIGVPVTFARLLFGTANKGDLVVILPAKSETGKS